MTDIERGHLLLVDDDERLRQLLGRFLTGHGFVVTMAPTAGDAARKLQNMQFDLIVLDVMLPDQSGVELTRILRRTIDVPILLLTAKGEVKDRIVGLEAGADDYLVKPFEPRELLLRIATILRRVGRKDEALTVVFGPFCFNTRSGTLSRDDVPIYLTGGEASLLRVLADKQGSPIPRRDLGIRAGIVGSDRAVDVQIARLRRKIEHDPRQPVYLLTVRGEGYALQTG